MFHSDSALPIPPIFSAARKQIVMQGKEVEEEEDEQVEEEKDEQVEEEKDEQVEEEEDEQEEEEKDEQEVTIKITRPKSKYGILKIKSIVVVTETFNHINGQEKRAEIKTTTTHFDYEE